MDLWVDIPMGLGLGFRLGLEFQLEWIGEVSSSLGWLQRDWDWDWVEIDLWVDILKRLGLGLDHYGFGSIMGWDGFGWIRFGGIIGWDGLDYHT